MSLGDAEKPQWKKLPCRPKATDSGPFSFKPPAIISASGESSNMYPSETSPGSISGNFLVCTFQTLIVLPSGFPEARAE